MENKQDGQGVQKTPEEIIAELTAERDDLKKKADVSSQNFERAKAAEAKVKELESKVSDKLTTEKPPEFDAKKLESEINEKVDLRVAGYKPEHIAEIEKFAKGAGVSLSEAAKSPFVVSAIAGMKALEKSQENTPAPSQNVKMFNGKPVAEIFKSGSPEEKQAAFESRLRGGVKTNE